MSEVNTKKIAYLSNLFLKKAQGNLLMPGQSTINLEMAMEIAGKALHALDEFDNEIEKHFPYTNFKKAMEILVSGKIPNRNLLNQAMQEFNTGLKYFANMQGLNIESLQHIQAY